MQRAKVDHCNGDHEANNAAKGKAEVGLLAFTGRALMYVMESSKLSS